MKTIIWMLLSTCFVISAFAQEQQSTQELLMSTKWEPQDFFYEGDCGYVRYTKTKFITEMKIDGELRIFDYSYYLSATPDTIFDSNKIGKSNMGKYI